jgi:hypothetical protein
MSDTTSATSTNAPNLHFALGYLHNVIRARMQTHEGAHLQPVEIPPLAFYDDSSPIAHFTKTHQPPFNEYILLLLALTPYLQPGFFRSIIAEHLPDGGDFPEFGGVKGKNHRDILPTGETAQFILAGDDLEKRLEVQRLFSTDHWFYQKSILQLEAMPAGEPVMSGRIILDPEIVELLTLGEVSKPRFSAEFPAEYIHTEMEWGDLVLHPNTLRQIHEIEHWINHNDTVMHEWGMHRKLKPGYRALFYGPPGTGKTLTASLLGKYTSKDVFRIDLSRVISKYIGETEKNLSKLFDKAENKDWILFFDEADALFGKRTDIRDAHDKYANQEVAYLLQRVEGYNGLVILATNQRANVDDAFSRRFQSIIHFPMPRVQERLALWQKAFPPQVAVAEGVDWNAVAARFELTGAGIMNVVQYCLIGALADGTRQVSEQSIEQAVLREYNKEGKIV